jgi:hypothetical protein
MLRPRSIAPTSRTKTCRDLKMGLDPVVLPLAATCQFLCQFFFPRDARLCLSVSLGANKKKGLAAKPFLLRTFPWTVTAEVASSSLVVPAILL